MKTLKRNIINIQLQFILLIIMIFSVISVKSQTLNTSESKINKTNDTSNQIKSNDKLKTLEENYPSYEIDLKDSTFNIIENDDTNTVIMLRVDQMPDFYGGIDTLKEFIRKELIYPYSARINNVEGIVYTTFVVTSIGKIINVKILRGIGDGCDEEAKRIIKAMPKWKEGKLHGVPVAVQMNIPIKFSLH